MKRITLVLFPAVAVMLSLLGAGPVLGQPVWQPDELDLSGVWSVAYHEDWVEVGTGPSIGDYTGLPINEAARQRALYWNPSSLNVPERQCAPLPLDYTIFWSNLRIWQELDPVTQQLVAYRTRREWGEEEQVIYMDGRPHPPEYAPHTWQGFSTGEWAGNVLKITTTHLKEGYSRRNGVPRSDQATVVQFYIRHGNNLTIARVVEDPVYLTEPLIHTTNHTLNLHRRLNAWPCEVVTELAEHDSDHVPHYLPWKNEHIKEYANRHDGMTVEIAMGGAEQLYPEFVE